MRAAVVFEKLAKRGDIKPEGWKNADLIDYPAKTQAYDESTTALITTPVMYLMPGTYTLSAEAPEGVTCKVYTWDHATGNGTGQFPENDGEGTLPYTFTVSVLSDVYIGLDYAGWESTTQGGTRLLPADVTEIRLHNNANSNTEDIFDAVALRPGEIDENAILAQARNCKSNVNFTIYPNMEAWNFCERSVAYLRIFDLDKAEDRLIFKGRVTGVKSSMTSAGHAQEVTCVSALDFLEDTAAISTSQASGTSSSMKLNDYMAAAILAHNKAVDWDRKLTYHSEVPDTVYTQRLNPQDTTYVTFADILTKGEKLYSSVGGIISNVPLIYEFRERYANDIA